jgi:23S rRNA (uridine2552-2'-O)-methyltransferase
MASKKSSGEKGKGGKVGASGALSGAGGARNVSVRVKTARKRKLSSTLWLHRQLNDPYVQRAKREGYRSRAAYKLLELDEKYHMLKSGMRVLDLGAAPGGWSQVVAEKIFAKNKNGTLVALDILEMDPIPNVNVLCQDFTAEDAPEKLKAALAGDADLVLSDMAAPTTGHNATDHLRIMHLADLAYDFARQVLAPNGAFICKLFQGGGERTLLDQLKKDFAKVRHAKPPASRSDSAEMYVVAEGFRGVRSEK